jgi:hypothetical protein
MGIVQTFLGSAVVALLAFLWIGAPILLTAWLRARRQETTRWQIALTDALDGQLGMVVAPVVKHRLWGARQIRIAMPFASLSTAGRILAVAHQVLSGLERVSPGDYQIVLTPEPEPGSGGERRSRSSAEPWPGDTALAA